MFYLHRKKSTTMTVCSHVLPGRRDSHGCRSGTAFRPVGGCISNIYIDFPLPMNPTDHVLCLGYVFHLDSGEDIYFYNGYPVVRNYGSQHASKGSQDTFEKSILPFAKCTSEPSSSSSSRFVKSPWICKTQDTKDTKDSVPMCACRT